MRTIKIFTIYRLDETQKTQIAHSIIIIYKNNKSQYQS